MWSGQTKLHDTIEAADLLRVVRRGLPVTLVIALAVGLLTFGILSLMPVKHVAEVRLAIATVAATSPASGRASDGVGHRPIDREAMMEHARAIGGPEPLAQVAKGLRLANQTEFGGEDAGLVGHAMRLVGLAAPAGKPAASMSILDKIRERLSIAVSSDGASIAVRFTSHSADLATAVVDRLAKAYQQKLAEKPVNTAKQELDELIVKIEQLNTRLSAVDGEILQVSKKIDQVRNGSGEAAANFRRFNELKAELAKAESLRAQSESQWKRARDLTRQGKVNTVPQLRQSPTIRRLIEQRVRRERELAQAEKTLLPAHPRLKRLKSGVAKAKQRLRQEVRSFVRDLEKAFRTAAFQVQDIERAIAVLQPKLADTSELEANLHLLRSRAGSLRSERQQLQQQHQKKMLLVVHEPPPLWAQIVMPAKPVASSGQLPKAPYTLVAMAAAFVLGLGLTITKEFVGGGLAKVRTTEAKDDVAPVSMETVSARLNLPATTMPVATDPATKPDDAEAQEPDPQHEDVFRLTTISGIADHLVDRGQEVSGFRSMLVGRTGVLDAANEGMKLAHLLGQAGAQVVVIDWNVLADRFAGSIGVADHPGVSDLLQGKSSFEDIVANVPNSRIHYISAGAGLDGNDHGMDEEGLNLVLDALDEAYDQIVVIGRYAAAQDLFEIVQGRFDAGIVVSDAQDVRGAGSEPANTFLGFEVTDIDIIHYRRPALKQRAQAPASLERQMAVA